MTALAAHPNVRTCPYIVCAYFTDDYAKEAETLKASLDAFGLPHHLRHFSSRGYWEANTRIKPEFLLDCLVRFPNHDLVYLDADAVVRAPLTLFEDFDADLGVFVAPEGAQYSHRYLTGTLYLRNNALIRAFVQAWIQGQSGMVLGVDQDSFSAAMAQHTALKVIPLPAAYVKIYDRGDEIPVIEHFQASRQRIKLQRALKKARNIVAGLIAVFLILWLLHQWL